VEAGWGNRVSRETRREPRACECKWANLYLGNINKETWSSSLGSGRKADDNFDEKSKKKLNSDWRLWIKKGCSVDDDDDDECDDEKKYAFPTSDYPE
jgi:hypothetical protein